MSLEPELMKTPLLFALTGSALSLAVLSPLPFSMRVALWAAMKAGKEKVAAVKKTRVKAV